jgi:hypothetical protein
MLEAFMQKMKKVEKRSLPIIQRKITEARAARKDKKTSGKGKDTYDTEKSTLDFDGDAPKKKRAKGKEAAKATDAEGMGEEEEEEEEDDGLEEITEDDGVDINACLLPVVVDDRVVQQSVQLETPKGTTNTRVTSCSKCGSFSHKPSECSWKWK